MLLEAFRILNGKQQMISTLGLLIVWMIVTFCCTPVLFLNGIERQSYDDGKAIPTLLSLLIQVQNLVRDRRDWIRGFAVALGAMIVTKCGLLHVIDVVFMLPNLYYCWILRIKPGVSSAVLIGVYFWMVVSTRWLESVKFDLYPESYVAPNYFSEYMLTAEVIIAAMQTVLFCALFVIVHVWKIGYQEDAAEDE